MSAQKKIQKLPVYLTNQKLLVYLVCIKITITTGDSTNKKLYCGKQMVINIKLH